MTAINIYPDWYQIYSPLAAIIIQQRSQNLMLGRNVFVLYDCTIIQVKTRRMHCSHAHSH